MTLRDHGEHASHRDEDQPAVAMTLVDGVGEARSFYQSIDEAQRPTSVRERSENLEALPSRVRRRGASDYGLHPPADA